MKTHLKKLTFSLIFLIFNYSYSQDNYLAENYALNEPRLSDSSSAPDAIFNKQTLHSSLVTIEYNYSERAAGATGFIATWNGKNYIFTNIHVLHGAGSSEANLLWVEGPQDPLNPTSRITHKSRIKKSFQEFQKNLASSPLPKIKTFDGTEIKVAPNFLFSKSRDVVLMPVVSDLKPLLIANEAPVPGRSLLIAGNPEAEHTLITLDAALKAVGPDRLEVEPINGKLQPGMSGGPVVDAKNGNVLAITSYAVKKLENNQSKYEIERIEFDNGLGLSRYKTSYDLTIRNFAFRLDNISDFQVITWSDFLKDCGILCAMEERSMNIYKAAFAPSKFIGSTEKAYEMPPDYDNSINITLNSAIRSFNMARDKPVELDKAWRSYQTRLESLLNQDFKNPSMKIKTNYLARIATEDVGSERRFVATKLRSLGGKFPSRSE